MWLKEIVMRRILPRVTVALLASLAILSSDWLESNRGQAWAGRLPQASPGGSGPVFRGVRPPGRGAKTHFKFYTAPRPSTGGGGRRGGTAHKWFWDVVPSARADRAGLDLASALDVVRQRRAEKGALTTVDEARSIKDAYSSEIATAARRFGVSEALLLAVIVVESRGRSGAVSPKGAQGLMQLMPATGRRFGVKDPFDVQSNILGGTAYLDWLLRHFGEDAVLALAGYNAGEGAVAKHGGVPPYKETRDYVVRVLDAFTSARELCEVVPESPRAPCVWATADAAAPAN